MRALSLFGSSECGQMRGFCAKHRNLCFAAIAFLIIVASVFFRVWNIGLESFDGDELFSRRVALESAPAAIRAIKSDLVHPPLYYLIVRAALPVTGSDAGAMGLRSLSLACGVATIAVVMLWGFAVRELMPAATLAAALLAVNSSMIFFSQQARSYSLYTNLVALLILWALVLDWYGDRLRYWGIGCILMVILLYTHYVGALYILALVIGTVAGPVAVRQKTRMIATAMAAGFALLPWVIAEAQVYRFRGLGQNLAWQGLPTYYDLRAVWAGFLGNPNIRGGTFLSCSAGFACVLFALNQVFKGQSIPRKRVDAVLFATAILPPLLLFAATRRPVALPLFGFRHLLPSISPFLVLVGGGAWEASGRFRNRTVFRFSCVLLLVCLQLSELLPKWPGPARQPSSAIASSLSQPRYRGLPVYTTNQYDIGDTVNHYLGIDRIRTLPPGSAELPAMFLILYRPAALNEEHKVRALVDAGSIVTDCRYYPVAASRYGTNQCIVQMLKTETDSTSP